MSLIVFSLSKSWPLDKKNSVLRSDESCHSFSNSLFDYIDRLDRFFGKSVINVGTQNLDTFEIGY